MTTTFIDKKDLPRGATLVDTIKANDAIVDIMGFGREPLELLRPRVKDAAIQEIERKLGIGSFYATVKKYEERNDVGGRIGIVTCEVYRV